MPGCLAMVCAAKNKFRTKRSHIKIQPTVVVSDGTEWRCRRALKLAACDVCRSMSLGIKSSRDDQTDSPQNRWRYICAISSAQCGARAVWRPLLKISSTAQQGCNWQRGTWWGHGVSPGLMQGKWGVKGCTADAGSASADGASKVSKNTAAHVCRGQAQ